MGKRSNNWKCPSFGETILIWTSIGLFAISTVTARINFVTFVRKSKFIEDRSSSGQWIGCSHQFGLKYKTPIGPLRIDLAWNLRKDAESDFLVLIGIGNVF